MANVPSEFYTSGLNTWDQFANAIELSCQHSTSLEKEFPIPCNDLSVASERFLVTIDKVCRVWNLKTGEVLLTFNERRILKVLIKESQLILSYLKITENNENFLQPQEGLNNNSKNEFDVNSTLERWNIENQELISSYQSSIGKVIHMKLHQSQLLCISVNQDREIWDLKSNIAQVIRLSDKKAVKNKTGISLSSIRNRWF
ncbi:MAG: hypothetical protein HWD61_13650 [Parachlamydiaceae bacterium]|nr:MAG: hypothetical protein HWD61_13650 [Parachlamydiaceae bacterium]